MISDDSKGARLPVPFEREGAHGRPGAARFAARRLCAGLVALGILAVVACGKGPGDDGLFCGTNAVVETAVVGGCPGGFADCGPGATGCQTDLATDVDDCGACGAVCGSENAIASCVDGKCVLQCDAGFADCNHLAVDGCEVNIGTDVGHCGACTTACGDAHATASCTAGACALACQPGFGDCNGVNADGCEVDLETTADHCGSCGVACALLNDTPTCRSGVCVPVCTAGFGDCDGNPVNGCETATSANVMDCGGCGHACVSTGGMATCAGGACGIVCTQGLGNCDGNLANGCETNLLTSIDNCGMCGKVCDGANAIAACGDGNCTITCTPNWGNCDGLVSNGCEANLLTDGQNCGQCGNVCPTACDAGQCAAITSVVTGTDHTCAPLEDGNVRCWGSNDQGQLGVPPSASVLRPIAGPAQFQGDGYALGDRFTCTTSEGGTACFGLNTSGQLGDGTMTSHANPTAVANVGNTDLRRRRGRDPHLRFDQRGARHAVVLGERRLGRGRQRGHRRDRATGANRVRPRGDDVEHPRPRRLPHLRDHHRRRRGVLLGKRRRRAVRRRDDGREQRDAGSGAHRRRRGARSPHGAGDGRDPQLRDRQRYRVLLGPRDERSARRRHEHVARLRHRGPRHCRPVGDRRGEQPHLRHPLFRRGAVLGRGRARSDGQWDDDRDEPEPGRGVGHHPGDPESRRRETARARS